MKSAEGFVADFIRHFSRDWLQESIAARDAEWQARVDRLEAALKHIVEVEAKAHATGKYSLAVEWCADKARTALAESEAAHG